MTHDDTSPSDQTPKIEWRGSVARWMQDATEHLRSSPLRRWKQLRDRLETAGVPPEGAVLADLHEEDGHLEFGIVASVDGRGFLFEFRYDQDADGVDLTTRDDARVSRWEELGDSGKWAHRRELEIAGSILAEERREHPGT